jgi:glycosyltransferase involved in cell wall biosynthesis
LLTCTKSFGLVDDERMMPFILNSADIFIGTATEEAFGQTLLEASSCGLPVVAFDRGGISDIVVDGQTGVLVKTLNADELYDAVNRLLADASLRAVLGEKARARVVSHFTLARQASAWLEYFKELSASRSKERGSGQGLDRLPDPDVLAAPSNEHGILSGNGQH